MPADLRQKADQLLRYHSELSRRLAHAGVRDVAELWALHERLRGALGALSSQEMTWAAEQAHAVIDELVGLHAAIATLQDLKCRLDPPSGG